MAIYFSPNRKTFKLVLKVVDKKEFLLFYHTLYLPIRVGRLHHSIIDVVKRWMDINWLASTIITFPTKANHKNIRCVIPSLRMMTNFEMCILVKAQKLWNERFSECFVVMSLGFWYPFGCRSSSKKFLGLMGFHERKNCNFLDGFY